MNKRRRFIYMLRKNFRAKRAKTVHAPDVLPIRGCILKCDLGLLLEHTGIYIGNDQIVSLNRHSEIRVETPQTFFPPGTNPDSNRIYTACLEDSDAVLAAPFVWKRAKRRINDKTEYNLLFNNCHRFTGGCITGNFENEIVSFAMLEDVLLKNIDLLKPKKSLWQRFKNFILRRKEPEEKKTFNWRPVYFEKKTARNKIKR